MWRGIKTNAATDTFQQRTVLSEKSYCNSTGILQHSSDCRLIRTPQALFDSILLIVYFIHYQARVNSQPSSVVVVVVPTNLQIDWRGVTETELLHAESIDEVSGRCGAQYKCFMKQVARFFVRMCTYRWDTNAPRLCTYQFVRGSHSLVRDSVGFHGRVYAVSAELYCVCKISKSQ